MSITIIITISMNISQVNYPTILAITRHTMNAIYCHCLPVQIEFNFTNVQFFAVLDCCLLEFHIKFYMVSRENVLAAI